MKKKRINLKSMWILQMLSLNLCHFEEIPYSSDSRDSACNAGDPGSLPGSGRSSGVGRATHSSILPREFHGQTVGPQRVGHDWATVHTRCLCLIDGPASVRLDCSILSLLVFPFYLSTFPPKLGKICGQAIAYVCLPYYIVQSKLGIGG